MNSTLGEALNMKELLNSDEYVNNTDKIRQLKHSEDILLDVGKCQGFAGLQRLINDALRVQMAHAALFEQGWRQHERTTPDNGQVRE